MIGYSNMEKSLKRFLKRKVKITLGFITAFLITGNIGYSEDYIIKEDEKKDEIVLVENNFDNVINKGLIIGGEEDSKYYGFKSNAENKKFINDGIINFRFETSKESQYSYGMYYFNEYSPIIENNGMIKTLTIDNTEGQADFSIYTPEDSKKAMAFGMYNKGNSSIIQNNGLIHTELNKGAAVIGITYENATKPTSMLNQGYLNVINRAEKDEGWVYSLAIGFYDSRTEEDANTLILDEFKNIGYFNVDNMMKLDTYPAGYGIHLETAGSFPTYEIQQIDNKGYFHVNSNGGSSAITFYYNSGKGILHNLDNSGLLKANSNTYDGIAVEIGGQLGASKAVIENFYNTGTIGGNGESGYGLQLYVWTPQIEGENIFEIGNIKNLGVLYGNSSAIYLSTLEKEKSLSTNKEKNNNYGIMAGNEIFSHTSFKKLEDDYLTNNGLYIYTNADNKNKIDKISIGNSEKKVVLEDNKEKTIINGNVDGSIYDKQGGTIEEEVNLFVNSSVINNANHINKNNLIINGVGIKDKGTLNIDENLELSDSIINSLETALTIEDEKEFKGNNIVLNGGVINHGINEVKYKDIIKGSDGNNTLILTDSIINGSSSFGAGNDIVDIKATTINGKIDLGNGNDKLILSDNFINGSIFGGNEKDELEINNTSETKIFNEINSFESITLNSGKITLFENSKITRTENLKLSAGSQINLRIDSTQKNGDVFSKHALYNNTDKVLNISGDITKIDTEKGTTVEEKEGEKYNNLSVINIHTNGLGVNSTIDFGNVKFEKNEIINSDKKDDYTQNQTTAWIKTNSILNGAKVYETELDNGKYNTQIKVEGKKDLFEINVSKPEKPSSENLYVKLNEIYKGIYTSGNDNFNALNDIVTNYIFEDKDKGDYPVVGNEKMQMATLLGYLRSVYAETPYSFSNESTRKSMGLFHDTVRDNNFKAKEDQWLIYGGLVHQSGDQEQTYYGRNYHGFDTETADTDAEIKLTGAYGQFEYGNTDTLSTGIMVGGTKSDVEVASSKLKGTGAYVGVYAKKDIKDLRLTAGAGYQYTEYDGTRRTINQTYSEDYKDKALNLYLDGKYSYDLEDNLYLEPKAGLSYTHIDQDSIKEGKDKALALDVNSKDFDVLEGTVGVDIKKVISTEKGKHSISAGISYRYILSGDEADYLTANYGGKDFEILVPHKNKGQVSLGARYEVELENGIFYDVKGNYFINTDSKENTNKNADKGEWRVGAGIGYKF